MEQQSKMNLPQHIIEEEILMRLRVKTLSRFKCVCKHWLSLIESRSFINRHHSRERDDDRLVLCLHYGTTRQLMRLIEVDQNPAFPQLENIVEFMGPQLGLFCLVALNGDITLFNPAMKMLKRVPPLFRNPSDNRMYGFGLDPSTRDYKIVSFHQPKTQSTTCVCIYNSTTDSWKLVKASRVDSMNGALTSISKAFVGGVYYWNDGNVNLAILAFDMRIERFRETQLPKSLTVPHYRIGTPPQHLVRICGRGDSLVLLAFEITWMDLWVMGKEGVWTRSFRVSPIEIGLAPYCLWKNELVLNSHCLDHLVLIDISTQKQRKVAIPLPPLNSHMHNVFFCRDSLVSIKGECSYATS